MKNWILSIKALCLCFAILLAPGCKQSGLPEINGVKGPQFNILNGQVIVTIKLLNANIPAGLKAPIPKTKNSSMELAPNAVDGGMLLVLYLDVEDLRSVDIGIGDGNTLPDGRPLPGVAGGTLEDSIRFDTQYKNISFYYHKKLFGAWIPFGFETAGISGYWQMKVGGKNVGFLGIVGSEGTYKAGGIIMLRLDNLKDKQFKKLIQKSKQNPTVMY
ncbi:MAG TPA: hypothetical protein VNJ01_00270 [Bacteriovoracaceae bacterium]|nr:hypothetical protein [Bacteriovoracaceae bacterium]